MGAIFTGLRRPFPFFFVCFINTGTAKVVFHPVTGFPGFLDTLTAVIISTAAYPAPPLFYFSLPRLLNRQSDIRVYCNTQR
jgi:hypothetical protein